MQRFDHIGIPTSEKQPQEMWVEASRVWVTDPAGHPQRIEYLRYEPDSPVTGPLRQLPHVAFQVDDLDAAMAGAEVLLGPFAPTDTLRVVFVERDGALVEYMENSGPENWFRKDQRGSR